jgi:hypothetical protein
LVAAGESLFAKYFNSLLGISAGGFEGLFAVHHADAGLFPEALNVFC